MIDGRNVILSIKQAYVKNYSGVTEIVELKSK